MADSLMVGSLAGSASEACTHRATSDSTRFAESAGHTFATACSEYDWDGDRLPRTTHTAPHTGNAPMSYDHLRCDLRPPATIHVQGIRGEHCRCKASQRSRMPTTLTDTCRRASPDEWDSMSVVCNQDHALPLQGAACQPPLTIKGSGQSIASFEQATTVGCWLHTAI